MECCERGILTPKETEGIELTFGNHEAMLTMIEKIGNREGLGNILAEDQQEPRKLLEKAPKDIQSTLRDLNSQLTIQEALLLWD